MGLQAAALTRLVPIRIPPTQSGQGAGGNEQCFQ